MSVHKILGREQDATDDMRLLCSRFDAALGSCEAGHWSAAAQQFATMLAGFPDDGPSCFYLDRSRRFVTAPPDKDDDVLIQLDAK